MANPLPARPPLLLRRVTQYLLPTLTPATVTPEPWITATEAAAAGRLLQASSQSSISGSIHKLHLRPVSATQDFSVPFTGGRQGAGNQTYMPFSS